MTNRDIEKLLFGKNTSKDYTTNQSQAFRHHIALNSVQTYDRVEGISDDLINKEFDTTLQEVGYHLSLEGKGYALLILKYGDRIIPTWGKVFDYKKVGGRLERLELTTEEVIIRADQNYPVVIRFYLDDNQVYKQKVILVDKAWEGIEEPIAYMEEEIPAVLLKNNALGEADIPKQLDDMLKQYEFFCNAAGTEFIKTSVQFLNNLLFGSTKSGKEWSEDLKDYNKDVHDISDDDGKLQGALGQFTAGGSTPALAMTIAEMLEDKILKFSMQYREQLSNGTNKHTLEIASQNQPAYEYLSNKMTFRTRQLNRFMAIYNRIANTAEVLTIKIPAIEEYKVANMTAQLELIKAQAANQLGQAQNQTAQALTAGKGDTNATE